jgi:hypothetical protein
MAGLVPAIHVFLAENAQKDVDARDRCSTPTISHRRPLFGPRNARSALRRVFRVRIPLRGDEHRTRTSVPFCILGTEVLSRPPGRWSMNGPRMAAPHRKRRLSGEARRALELLVDQHGTAKALMLALGFTSGC